MLRRLARSAPRLYSLGRAITSSSRLAKQRTGRLSPVTSNGSTQ